MEMKCSNCPHFERREEDTPHIGICHKYEKTKFAEETCELDKIVCLHCNKYLIGICSMDGKDVKADDQYSECFSRREVFTLTCGWCVKFGQTHPRNDGGSCDRYGTRKFVYQKACSHFKLRRPLYKGNRHEKEIQMP